jgi:hypothetical protein
MTGTALLQRITTEYVEAEDRIRIIAEVQGGSPMVLWFSQRMLARLLPGLIKWLDGQGSRDVPFSQLMQGFAQQAAQSELTPQPPVRPTLNGPVCLVQSVDVGVSETLMSLTFRGASGEAAKLNLEAKPMRQWLFILRNLCQKAEWKLDVWPEWFEGAVQPPETKRLTFH